MLRYASRTAPTWCAWLLAARRAALCRCSASAALLPCVPALQLTPRHALWAEQTQPNKRQHSAPRSPCLQERHGVGALLGGLLADLMRAQPPDPLQFMADALTLGAAAAQQDAATGLPRHRREKLERVFASIAQAGSGGMSGGGNGGAMSLRALQAFANRHGGEALTSADLRALFEDFKPGDDRLVGLPHFLAFFGRAARRAPNGEFDAMIAEMTAAG